MTCQTFIDTLADRPVSDARLDEAMQRHAQACGPCRTRWARHQSLRADLSALAGSVRVPSDALEDMELRLRAAFEAQHASAASAGESWVGWRVWATAAVVVLAAAITWYPSRPRKAETPAPVNRPLSLPGTTRAPDPEPAQPATARPEPRRPSPRTRPVASRATTEASEELASFIPLPGSASLPDFESGHVVRVDMPIAGLAAYGFQPRLDALSDEVSADVLVGQDGLPRAIRLVSFDSHGSRR